MKNLITRAAAAGLAASAPFAAFAALSAMMAQRHAATLFPLGQQFCGQGALAHCAWCLAAPAGAAMAAAAFVIAAARIARPAILAVILD